jgi:hypothetical protein
MNRKGFIKIGLVLLSLFLFILVFFFISNSTAVIDKESYLLGEKVKIDLKGIENYRVKVVTPSKSYVLEGSDDSFSFEPEEIGSYRIELQFNGEERVYSFEVIGGAAEEIFEEDQTVDEDNESVSENNWTNENKTDENRIFVNRPVRRAELINIPEGNRKISLKIPSDGGNVSVYRLINGDREKVSGRMEDEGLLSYYANRIFSGESERKKHFVLENAGGNVELEYYLPGPVAEEQRISEKEKRVLVSSPEDIEYENVVAYTNVGEFVTKEEFINVYWEEEESYLSFVPQDKDSDGFIDYLEWEIPHLSNQTFNITILEESDYGIANFEFSAEEFFLLGERVKFSFRGMGSYEARVVYPSGKEYSRIGTNDIFLINLAEEGMYSLEVVRGGAKSEYKFYVMDVEVQGKAEINKPVKWRKLVNQTVVEFLTDPPTIAERDISTKKKQVVISSPEGLHYENVFAYTTIPEIAASKDSIRLYWVEEGKDIEFDVNDTDGNGLLDMIFWTIPHLSQQTFEIIFITKAEHLDENRLFVKDVYGFVKERDGVWVEIPQENYLRVVFEKNLTSERDITIYARSSSGATVEVYEKDRTEKIADFGVISADQKYRVILEGLSGEQDTFDLKVVGGSVEFDYVIDPPEDSGFLVFSDTFTGATGTNIYGSYTPDLGVGWTEIYSDSSNLIITGNQLDGDNGNNDGSFGYADISGAWRADQMVKVTYSAQASGDDLSHLVVRADSSLANAYVFTWSTTAANTVLWKRVSSSNTDLNTSCGGDNQFTTGNLVTLKVVGNFIEVYDGNTVVCSATDSDLSSGRAGVGLGSSPRDAGADQQGQRLDDLLIYLFNRIPTTQSVGINSSDGTNYSTSNLNCFATITDGDADSLNVSVIWYKNNQTNLTIDYNNSYSNGTSFNSILWSGNLTGGDSWKCGMRTFDGTNYSNWSNSSSLVILSVPPVPSIIINSPTTGSTFADVTPTLNVTLNGTAGELWYTTNNGVTNITICKSCSGTQATFMYLTEGSFVARVYANNSAGDRSSNSTSFTIDMDENYYDSFGDNSSLITYNDITWQLGNVSYVAVPIIRSLFEGWESGAISSNWSVYGTSTNRTRVITGSGPYDGSYHLVMDSSSSGTYSLNEITTTYDFSSARDILLSFYEREWDDEDNACPASWTGHTDGDCVAFTCDGNTWYNIYDLTGANSDSTYSQKGPINITADPDFCSEVNSSFAVRFQQYDNWPLTNDGIGFDNINITWQDSSGKGNFTAYQINTTDSIARIMNVTWEESNTNANNNISVQLSANGGSNWYDVIKGQGLAVAAGKSLIYRAIFSTSEARTISLLDMNISWSDTPIPAPSISINLPTDGSTLADVTPTLNVTLSGLVNSLWYTTNNGVTNITICNSCFGTQTAFMYLAEGDFVVRVYANDSVGTQSTNSSDFTIDMNRNYYDSFDDNSSLITYNSVGWQPGNVSFTGHTLSYSEVGFSDATSNVYQTDSSGAPHYFLMVGPFTASSQWNFDPCLAGGNVEPLAILCDGTNVSVGNFSEGDVCLDQSWTEQFNGGTWAFGWDLDSYFSGDTSTSFGYGQIYVWSNTADSDVRIRYDKDDTMWLYVNDVKQTLSDATSCEAASADENFVDISFEAGWNKITWAVAEDSGQYEIFFRFVDRDDNAKVFNYTASAPEAFAEGSFVAYHINTTGPITSISNITWNEDNTDENNTIRVEISPDNGLVWYNATNGLGVLLDNPGHSLLYRVVFSSSELSNIISLLDMNISWSDTVSAAPGIVINSPQIGVTVADVTPTLNVTLDGTAKNLWYTLGASPTRYIICTDCGGEQTTFLHLEEGSYTVNVYANNSIGDQTSNSTSFTVDMDRNYYDSFGDNSSFTTFGDIIWGVGNISFSSLKTYKQSDFSDNQSNIYQTDSSGAPHYFLLAGPFTASAQWNFDPCGTPNLEPLAVLCNGINVTVGNFSGGDVCLDQSWTEQFNGGTWPFGWDLDDDYFVGDPNQVFGYGQIYVWSNTADSDVRIRYDKDDTMWLYVNDVKQTLSDATSCEGAVADENFVDISFEAGWNKITWAVADDGGLYDIYFRFVDRNDNARVFNYTTSHPLGDSESIIAYSINTTQAIKNINNITWNEDNTDENNTILVELSVNNGANWYSVVSGQNLSGFSANDSLTYRVTFTLSDFRTISLLDMNISWSEPPSITIIYPTATTYGSQIVEMNYSLVVAAGESADSCWYSLDGGNTTTLITCGQNITGISSNEGSNTWLVYANDSEGSVGFDSVTFIVDSSAPNITFINQTDENGEIVDESNPLDQGENLTIYVNVTDDNVDSVWIVVWDTIKGGTEKARIFFTYVAGFLWKAIIPTDYTWDNLIYQYTIYANDSAGYESEYDGNFTLMRMEMNLTLVPNPSNGTGNVSALGHVNFTNGSVVGNWPINLYLDGSLLLSNNLSVPPAYGPAGTVLNFTDTSSDDFNEGIFNQTRTDGENITLSNGNASGYFVKTLDAGARVEWESVSWQYVGRACSGIMTYREGDSRSFAGTYDTYISGDAPTTNYGDSADLLADTSPAYRSLIMFDVLGYGAYKIPYDSTINGANITVQVYDAGDNPSVYEVLENWTESQATYNNRLTGTAWSSTGCAAFPSRSNTLESTMSGSLGASTFDITNAMRRWTNQTSDNYGIVIHPSGSNGLNIRSSEYATQNQRPLLTVGFSSSDCTTIRVLVRTSNDELTWSDWQQVDNGGTFADPNNASRYLQYKIEMAAVNTSFTPTLKEILVNYTAILTDSNGNYNYAFASPTAFDTYQICANTSYGTMDSGVCSILSVQSGVNPEVDLISPNDGLWFAYGNLTLIYNVSDLNDDIVNTTLIINGLWNQTNSSAIFNGLYNNFTINFTSGRYNWTVHARDSNNNFGTDVNRTFYVDLIDPNVTLLYPLPGSSHSGNEVNLSFNATDNMDSVLSCDIVLDSDVIYPGVAANNGEIVNRSSGILSGGIHYWNVTCTDEASRSFTSETWNFTLADTPPSVILLWPEPSYLDSDGEIEFVFNATDDIELINCTLFINDTFYSLNQTEIENGENSTINATGLLEGDHNWTVECFDVGGASDKPSAREFSVDLYYPIIALNAPEDDSVINYSDVSFNFTANDTVDSSLLCNLTIDGIIAKYDIVASSGVLENVLVENLTDGSFLWNVSCVDDAGHLNGSVTRNVTVHEIPTINLTTGNESSYTTSSITLSYVPRDNTNLSSCSLYLDSVWNQTDPSIDNDEENSFGVDGISDGTHAWYVECNDTINLTGRSQTYVFYVDHDPPSITLHNPNDEEIFAVNVTFNFTAVDIVDGEMICNLSVDNNVEAFDITAQNGTPVNVSVSGIVDGSHTWYVNCTDDAGNQNGSLIFNFTKLTNPEVDLIWPDNGYWFNVNLFNLTYYPQDDEGFRVTYLIINGEINQTNSTTVAAGSYNNFTVSNISDGFYNWTVNVTDVRGLNGTDVERNFYVDTHVPDVILNYPNQSLLVETNNVTFNFTAYDNLDYYLDCNLTLDGEAEFSGVVENATEIIQSFLVVDGNHSWYVSCFDNATNLNVSQEINFTVKAPPNVTLNSPSNYYWSNNTNVTFYYTPLDPIGISSCDLYIDGKFNSTVPSVPNVQNSHSVSNLIEGIHNWTVNCTDSDDNTYAPPEKFFYVDVQKPNVSLIVPVNATNTLREARFNFTAYDNLADTLNCSLYVDATQRGPVAYLLNGSMTERIVSSLGLGNHLWNVSCKDNATNLGWSDTWQFNVTLTDLSINESDISFNNSDPKENQTVVVNATIRNLINVTVTNITVSFFDGDPFVNGRQIGNNQTISVIPALGEATVSVEWFADLGTSEIFVHVDPPTDTNGSIEEWNEGNNVANKTNSVLGWHFLVGDIDSLSEFELAEGISNSSVKRWIAANYDSGNLYAADSESAISWMNLQALGRTSGGANSFDDFEDMDTLLNMSSFEDSVFRVYTNTTAANNLSSYLVFKKTINNVPNANSTNNTNFMTGILWDMSDDVGDGEYSVDDVEDLVLLTAIQRDKQGAYGVYDYEIRIPASLREYKKVELKEVVFYAELR